jgi:hypothetical protein
MHLRLVEEAGAAPILRRGVHLVPCREHHLRRGVRQERSLRKHEQVGDVGRSAFFGLGIEQGLHLFILGDILSRILPRVWNHSRRKWLRRGRVKKRRGGGVAEPFPMSSSQALWREGSLCT